MNLYVKNNRFWFELENLTRLFFPNEKINVYKNGGDPISPYVYAVVGDIIEVSVCVGDFYEKETADHTGDDNTDELKTVQLLYQILSKLCAVSQPWGLLTGVRPVKLLRRFIRSKGINEAKRQFLNEFYVSPEKLDLALLTEQNESRIIEMSRPESFSLYVGIPFCPSRCSYCSFVMSSIERAGRLIPEYTELLCREITETARTARELGLRLESVYFGGGTPTTLSPEQLDAVLGTVNKSFDMTSCREFTVEAGRPDTITADRLEALKRNGVSRISINPQTTDESVLENIGRKHTVRQFFEAYELASAMGFDNINTDLIAGLPTDTPTGFQKSLDDILSLDSSGVTVHTLCVKRAARLSEEGMIIDPTDAKNARSMLAYAKERLSGGYIPYYLYRQSRMIGNLENVGWSKLGCECLYNVYVMDETHTVLSCGSGGVTKLKNPRDDHLERIFNFKYPYEYINRFDEIIERKARILTFYSQINS